MVSKRYIYDIDEGYIENPQPSSVEEMDMAPYDDWDSTNTYPHDNWLGVNDYLEYTYPDCGV